MIDTDKYEGHTPAPWNADDDGGGKYLHIDAYGEEGDVCVARIVNGNWVDTQLIADAPLLLAEVKRLKNELTLANDLLHDVVLGHNLRTKNRKMWTSVLLDGGGPPSGNLTMLHLHEWFLEQQGEEE